MAFPLILTKFQMPTQGSGVVVRPRLLQQLNAGLGGKLTLISAPTGFGKTTLACAWIKESGRPTAWIALDKLDNDPLRFLSYLVRAIQTVQSGFGADLLETLNTATPLDFDPVPTHFLEILAADIAAIQSKILLTLDDYHIITQPAIQSVLQFLITHHHTNLHIVLISRADPPWPLARLRASREMNEIRVADLRFTEQEAAEFLNASMRLELTAEQIATLETRTEGWIAGLQLAALSLQGQANPQEIITNLAGSHRFIADYLIEEVLDKQSAEVQDFLLKTSVLNQMNAALCDEVTGRSDSQDMLLLLEQSNLFLQQLDQDRKWYRYHHLFADLLRIKLKQTYPGLTSELQRRTSSWYAEQGHQLDALLYALEAGDMPMAERLFTGNIFLLFNHEDLGAVLQKLVAISDSVISDYPWLMIARVYLWGSGQFQESLHILETVAELLDQQPESLDNARLRGYLEAVWAIVYNTQGDVTNTVQHAQQAEVWLPPEEVDMRAMNMAVWGDMLSKDGHDPNAMPILERALELALQANNPHVVVPVAAALTMGHMGAGRMRAAHRVCLQVLSIADDYQRRTGQEILSVCTSYAILARIYSEWNEKAKSVEFGERALALSERIGHPETEVMCRIYFGHALMFLEDPSQGLQIYQRALEMAASISPWVEQSVVSMMVDGLLDREPLDEVTVRETLKVYDKTQTEYPLLLKARFLLKTGQPAVALEVADTWLASMSKEVILLAVRTQALRALAFQALGDESTALEALTQALTLAEPENRMVTFLREGRSMEKLLRVAERKAICPDFTHELLAAFAQRTACVEKRAPEALLESYSKRELEVLRLLAANLDAPEIAGKLVVSVNTVRTHIKNLYRKLNAHSRHEALTKAKANKII